MHKPQLDGVRGIAIIGVLAAHLLPGWQVAHEGARGVSLFFVLSGFLITSILMESRLACEQAKRSKLAAFRSFYARRALRIFPLYYAVLVALWLIGDEGARFAFGWRLAYLSNMPHVSVVSQGNPLSFASVNHFWSLCVEEQFYLVWPWLVLFLPKRMLFWTTVAIVASATVYHVEATQWTTAHVLPLYSADALGCGALLAFSFDPSFGPSIRPILSRIGPPIAIVLVASTVIAKQLHYIDHPRLAASLTAAYVILFAMLVGGAAEGSFSGWIGRLLELRQLRWLGTVSYGLYVYHGIAMTYIAKLMKAESWQWSLATLTLTLAVSALSFYLFERPVLRLKRNFPSPQRRIRISAIDNPANTAINTAYQTTIAAVVNS